MNYPRTRREFLQLAGQGLGLLAYGAVAPSFLARSVMAGTPLPEKDRSILVLLQLAGGNDGLNTFVPWADDRYHRLRPRLALAGTDVLKIDDHHGFHPSCEGMHRLFMDGKLSVIQNVGYPNPNRSHFRSMEIWETAAESDAYLPDGWIGRYFDNCCRGTAEPDPLALNIGNELPTAFLSAHPHARHTLQDGNRRARGRPDGLLAALEAMPASAGGNADFLRHVLMDSLVTERRVLERIANYRAQARYPQAPLGQALRNVAGLIASGLETRVYFVSHGGFDTHANQADRHRQLLTVLSSSLQAFQADLEAHGLQDQVLTMTFSEFGRRPSENASGGTDHGTAAPQFIMGSRLKGSLHGQAPDLKVRPNADFTHSTDFRSVYATVLQQWFGADPLPVLGRPHPPVDFLM